MRRPTGIGIHTLELLRELVRRDEFRFVGLSHAPVSAPTDAELERLGIALEVEPAPLGVIWQQLRLPRRLRKGDLALFWSPLLTLPPRLAVPGVVTIHDLAAIHHPETLPWKIRWSLLPFLGPTVDRAARIVCISRETAREVVAEWPRAASRVVVVPNGVAPEFRPASDGEKRAIRERLALPERYLLYAGTVEPRKNLEVLLDAWERLRDEVESAPPLLVAGPEGWHSEGTERRMRALATAGLRRLGHLPRPDLVDTIRAATLFVYPSYYEGFGLPPLEALASGVPAVVADRSSLPEVAGDAGFRFDPDDAEDLLALFVRLLDAPEVLAEAGRRGVEHARSFTWERAAASLAGVFHDALASARGATTPPETAGATVG